MPRTKTLEITHGRARLIRALNDWGMTQQDIAVLMACNIGRINEVIQGDKWPNAGTADLKDAHTRAMLGLCLTQTVYRLIREVTPILQTDDVEAI